MSNEADKFSVDVIYALADKQKIISIKVTPGTSFIDAVRQSRMAEFYPEIDLEKVKLGTFSRAVKHNEIVEQGMRIEIYRPLIADPKDVRRKRAEKAKEEGRANKITGGRA